MSTFAEKSFSREIEGSVNAFYILVIVIVIVMLFITGVFIANTFFFAEIRKSGCGSKISTTEGDVMFWFNLILAFISGIIVLFAIFMLVFAKSKPEYLGHVQYVPGTVPGYTYRAAQYGYRHPGDIETIRAFELINRELEAQVAI